MYVAQKLVFEQHELTTAQYSHLHSKLKSSIDTKIKAEENVRAKLSDILDRSMKTAPDQAQRIPSNAPSITARPTAVDYSQMTVSELRLKATACSSDLDVSDWSQDRLLSWLEDKELEECKNKNDTNYNNWPHGILRKEAMRRASAGVGNYLRSDGMSADEIVFALMREDLVADFIVR